MRKVSEMEGNNWIIRDLRTGKTSSVGHHPSDEDIIAFKNTFGYSAVQVIREDYGNHVVEVKPVDLSAE